MDTKLEERLEVILKAIHETIEAAVAPLRVGLHALTDRQNKLEQAIQGLYESQSANSPPKKPKHHPYQ